MGTPFDPSNLAKSTEGGLVNALLNYQPTPRSNVLQSNSGNGLLNSLLRYQSPPPPNASRESDVGMNAFLGHRSTPSSDNLQRYSLLAPAGSLPASTLARKRRAFFSFHSVDIMRVNNVRQAWKI